MHVCVCIIVLVLDKGDYCVEPGKLIGMSRLENVSSMTSLMESIVDWLDILLLPNSDLRKRQKQQVVTVAWRHVFVIHHQNKGWCISDIRDPINSKLNMYDNSPSLITSTQKS